MADLSPRDQAFAKVDLMTAELEMTGSIYDGFSTAIVVKGQPRTVGLFREFDDAVQVMALIDNNRQTTAARAKPLDWRKPTDTARDYGREECELIAPGLGGVYGLQRDGDHWIVWQADDEFAFWKASTREEAKGKAETDWQRAFSAKATAPCEEADVEWLIGLIGEAVVMNEDQERVDEGDPELRRISEGVLTALRPYLTTPARAEVLDEVAAGWIVGNSEDTRWRSWDQGNPVWVDDRAKATRYARREDAEAVHAEDEDAWCVKPYESTTSAVSVCSACGDKGYVEHEGGDGEGWPSKPEIETCTRCNTTPAADADRVRIAELEGAIRNARRQLNDMQGDCVFYNLGSVLPEVVAARNRGELA